jgi:SAM-dependent methyltransferase
MFGCSAVQQPREDRRVVERAMSFGSAAAAYERFRPGYPDDLVDLVLEYAGRPVRSALEIGAGTGKATRAFAGRGIAVTAVEPDRAMLEELRRHVPPSVTPVLARFEDYSPAQHYDLVYAAAALHWTSPQGRWLRVAAALGPSGVFTSLGGPISLADADLDATVVAARAQWLTDDGVPSPDGTPASDPLQWPGTELTADPAFTDIRQETLPRRLVLSADDYVGYLSTVSAYLQLSEGVRSDVLRGVFAVLPPYVECDADVIVHLARLV